MKIQKLTIHNIASIEDAVIDFEAEPIKSSGVFLISGNTGSGKSTILDAICLALYNDTPRLNANAMEGKVVEIDGKARENEVSVADPRQLLRINTGEGYVWLTFKGSNGVHYEAKWYVQRANKKANGKLQGKKWSLKNLDQNFTHEIDADIKAEIALAVGLDFTQFCRTTMLAQGQFTRFLNSKDEEKAAILETITGEKIYTRIGATVYRICKQHETAKNRTAEQLKDKICLTPEQVAAKVAEMEALKQQQKDVELKQKEDNDKLNWLRSRAQALKGLEEARTALEVAEAATKSEDFVQREATVRDWNASIDARKSWADAQREAAAILAAQNGIPALEQQYLAVLAGLAHMDADIMAQEGRLKDIEGYLNAEQSYDKVYTDAGTIVNDLKRIVDGRSNIASNQNAVEALRKKQETELLPALKGAQDDESKAREALEKCKAGVEKAQEDLDSLNLPQKRLDIKVENERLDKIEKALTSIQSLAETTAKRVAEQDSLEQQRAEIESKKVQSQAKASEEAQAHATYQASKAVLEANKPTVDELITNLRSKLHVGDTCPLCRQELTHALPQEEELQGIVDRMEQTCREAEEAYNAVHNECITLRSQIEAQENVYIGNKTKFDADKSVDTARETALDACRACGLEEVDAASLEAQKLLVTQAVEALEKEIESAEAKALVVKDLHKKRESAQTALDSATKKCTQAQNAFTQNQSDIKVKQALIDSTAVEVQMLCNKVDEHLAQLTWEADWRQNPTDFGSELKNKAGAYAKAQKDRDAIKAAIALAKSGKENIRKVQETITAEMPQWAALVPAGPKKVEDILDAANAVLTQVTESKTRLSTARENLKAAQERVQAFLLANESFTEDKLAKLHGISTEANNAESKALQDIRTDLTRKEEAFRNAQQGVGALEDAKPALEEDDTEETLQNRVGQYGTDIMEIGRKQGLLQSELDADALVKQQTEELQQRFQKESETFEKWERLNKLIGDAKGNNFRKIAMSFVLANLVHSANTYLQKLTDRYKLQVVPGTFIIMVEDAYQGSCARVTSTISGGETFIVSLSLALALSDIGSQWQVDTLFIDEGFGTLSGDLLQKAINTLRTLHKQAGKHVGIISHVEEIRERIPVQIQVVQNQRSSSSEIKIVPEVKTEK